MLYTKPMFCFFPFGTTQTMQLMAFSGFDSLAAIMLPPIPAEAFKLYFRGRAVKLDGKHVIIIHVNFDMIERLSAKPSLIATMVSAVYSQTATIWFMGTEKRLTELFKKLSLYCQPDELYVHIPTNADNTYVISRIERSGKTKHTFSRPLPKKAFVSLS